MANNQDHLTRLTLLQRACDSENQDAWQEFSEIYRDFIHIFLNKFQIPTQESEDITQQVMLRLWKYLGSYDSSKAKFRTWLVTIIRNTAMTHMSSLSKSNHISADSNELFILVEDDRQNVLEERYESEWKDYITKLALKNVGKQFRGNTINSFKLSLKGKSIPDIAVQLEMKDQSVRNSINRVKVVMIVEIQRLRKELET
jgi:RNA polymerase sigma factor (sigma-70 family)